MLVKDVKAYRAYLNAYYKQYPTVFPTGFDKGFQWHDSRISKKHNELMIRRIKLTDGRIYELSPCSMMPYLSGQTSLVSKGLLLRHWAVPYTVIAQVLGRDASFWECCEQSLARISVVGSVTKRGALPIHLAADEKVTYWNGQEVYIGLSISGDCVLGAELSLKEDTAQLQEAYGVFAQEARDVEPTYQPKSVNLDGWKATNQAWTNLFPHITIVLCFLHAFLKIRDVGKGLKEGFHQIGNKIWQAYRQPTESLFRTELATLLIWASLELTLNERVKAKIEDLCGKVDRFAVAYEHPECYRTSNQIDRPMNALDRYLYQIRYFKGHRQSANQKVRAWALIYNFMPFCDRVQKRKTSPKKSSRFEERNGFVYSANWLENLLIAGSMNGFRASPKIR